MADDRKLWRAVVRDVKPLKRGAASPLVEVEPEPDKLEGPAPRAAKRKPPARPPLPPARPPRPAELPPLVAGRAAGLDKRTALRLKRGQLEIEATLDLHRHTQAEARAALDGFVAGNRARGLRCVLVITGKGRVSEDGGVLRAMVPRWLDQPPNRARIVAIAPAQPKHGGAGALYVLLRRKR